MYSMYTHLRDCQPPRLPGGRSICETFTTKGTESHTKETSETLEARRRINLRSHRFFSGTFGSYVTAASNSESGSFRL
jgi:hypothetical protein